MRVPDLRFVALLLGVICGGASAGAGEFKLPPITGELRGDFLPFKIAGAPKAQWTIKVQEGQKGRRVASFVVESVGAELRGEAQLDASGEVETWRLTEGKIDVAQWMGVLLPNLGPDFAGMSVGGALEITGEGTRLSSKLKGRATVDLKGGRLDHPTHKLLLEGIALEVAFDDIAARRTAPVRLTWTGGRYDVVTLGAGRVVFEVDGDDVKVEEASLFVFGGELGLGAFTFSFSRPEVAVVARLVGADIALIYPLLPPVVTEAKGRVDGSIALRRDATGIQVGDGRLALRGGETAELRLAPTPGLLSASLPPAALKYYPGLGGIEMGTVPLKATLLEVTFTPQGDAEGRTAMVHLIGGPVDPSLTAPIDLNINVRGPLEMLIKFGSRLRFGTKP